jgi:hypothetical protein
VSLGDTPLGSATPGDRKRSVPRQKKEPDESQALFEVKSTDRRSRDVSLGDTPLGSATPGDRKRSVPRQKKEPDESQALFEVKSTDRRSRDVSLGDTPLGSATPGDRKRSVPRQKKSLTKVKLFLKSGYCDSNTGPSGPKPDALANCATPRNPISFPNWDCKYTSLSLKFKILSKFLYLWH